MNIDKLFEYVVAVILRRNGYLAAVPRSFLSGRGGSHQIDVVGLYPLQIPFVFHIKLIAEAKCYAAETIGIEIVRGLDSTINDFIESLPKTIVCPTSLEQNGSSCTYRGAIFSTTPFSSSAYMSMHVLVAFFLYHYHQLLAQ